MLQQWLLLIAKYTSLMVIKKFVSHISSHISGLSKFFFCLVQSQEACPDKKRFYLAIKGVGLVLRLAYSCASQLSTLAVWQCQWEYG